LDVASIPRSIAEFGLLLRSGRLSAVELTARALNAAKEAQLTVNAFITFTEELALAQAAGVDADIAAGHDSGPLMGVPIGVKDVFDVAGVPTTAGSRALLKNVPKHNSGVVSRLESAGAVLLGKTNMDQFAFGPHQDDFGRTNCPSDQECYAGGSSGGSAAAVATGCLLGALGSDAGGSTRFPAACCGVVGFKPSFGRVPTTGVFPTFSSLDHVGEITRSVEDMKLLFAATADTPSRPAETELRSEPRIAVLRDWEFHCGGAVREGVEDALVALGRAGADVREGWEIHGMEKSVETLIATVAPEAFLELRSYLESDRASFPTALVDLLEAGATQSAVEYVAAQLDRRQLHHELQNILSENDVIVMPTSLDVAWRWEDIDSTSMGARDRSTTNLPLANLTGHPAISVPVVSSSLPVGLQLVGPMGADEFLLDVATWTEARISPDPSALGT
jgi:aspartyl-tRNA(Asn)/glutamyl-tRNA(Gln) amidotransferase subunit A